VAEREGRIVGFAALEVYSKKLAEIRSLAVADEMQGRGVGRRLVGACVERAHERNILEVMVVTSSEDFFRACGFHFALPGEKKALFLQTRDE
jgi:N-acetylglutamate synthase-like GNAT family acetyltransferase